MAYEGGGNGRGKPGGFGGKKPYVKREGGYDKKPREGGSGEKRPYAPRGDRPYAARAEGGEKRPYVKREGGYDKKPREGGYDRKPREGGSSFGEKRPYQKREGGFGEKRPYAPRGDRPYAARAEGGEKRPYVKREGGYDRKPREGGSSYGEKRPYQKREGGFGGEKRPYSPRPPREGGDRPYRARSEGAEGGEKRPYTPRAPREGGYDRKPREGGSFGEKRPYAPRAPREGGYERKPREDFGGEREGFSRDRGDGPQARFDGKRQVRREVRDVLVSADGWLVGYHAVLAALTIGRRAVRKVWLMGEAQGELATVLAANPGWEIEMKAKPEFEKEFGDAVHQGVAALVGNLPQPTLPELLATKPKLLVALDQVTDPHNLGAIVRSCAAFGATGVIVTEHRAAGLSATAAKVAAGAMETVPVVEVVNLVQSIEMMQEAGFTVIGLAGEAEVEISTLKISGPVCLVVGSEGEGLRRLTRERCDQLVKIAIASTVESLNVSVATGVALNLLAPKK